MIYCCSICNTKYNFTIVDVGPNESNNDSNVLTSSEMGHAFENNTLHIPPNEEMEGGELEKFLYFLVGNKIFPATSWLMQPYPGKLPEEERVCNYHHSRARRVIENMFGILRACRDVFSAALSKPQFKTQSVCTLSFHSQLSWPNRIFYVYFF